MLRQQAVQVKSIWASGSGFQVQIYSLDLEWGVPNLRWDSMNAAQYKLTFFFFVIWVALAELWSKCFIMLKCMLVGSKGLTRSREVSWEWQTVVTLILCIVWIRVASQYNPVMIIYLLQETLTLIGRSRTWRKGNWIHPEAQDMTILSQEVWSQNCSQGFILNLLEY